jgi:hypothetical protein
MSSPPESSPITRLIDDNPVDPGTECRLPSERVDRAEDSQEDLLRKIERFVAIPQQVQRKLKDHALVARDEFCARRLLARGAPRDKRGFAAPDFRPSEGSCVLH